MRKNWKRFGAMLLALVMVLSLVPTAALAARISDEPIAIAAPGAEEAATLAETPATLAELNANTSEFDYPLTNSMVSAVSEKNPPGYVNDGYVYWAIDYNDSHWWHQAYDTDEELWFAFSLPAAVEIAGVRYQKRTDGNNSYFGDYEIQTKSTADGEWTTITGATGTWGNDNNVHVHEFTTPVTAQYIRVHGTGANRRNRTAKNFHLVLADTARATVTGTVTNGGEAVANATVQVYCNGQASYKTATTNDQGAYSLVLPKDSREWKLSVSNEGLMAVATVTTSETAITQDLALTSPTRTVSGTVTTNGTTPLAGAKVMLVGTAANHYPVVSGIEAVTDSNGVYNLNVNTVPAGTYNIRVFKEDRGATIIAEPFQITATEVTEEITGKNAQLPEYADYADEGYDIKSFDFTSADGINLVKLAGDNATVTPAIADGVLKLTYTQDGNSAAATRDKNFVLIGGTPMMNGEIEFDATRQNGNRRFGLTFRMQNDTQHMIYVGQFLGSSAWGHEHWNGSGNNVWSDGNADYSANVPSFGAGETRHFKIKISGEQVSLWIDGVEIFADKYLSKGDGSAAVANKTPVMTAGSVGFAYGGTDGSLDGSGTWNETITIDNLRVVRFDPAFAVTVDNAVANGTLNVTNNNIAQGETWDKSRTSEGDVIVVSGTGDTGYALNAVSITKADDSQTTITPTLNANGTFQFTMPAYAVTVSGTFLPKVTGVTIDTSNGLKVGKTVTANATVGGGGTLDETKLSYQWYHLNNAGQEGEEWVACTDSTAKTKTIAAEDEGKKIKVVVTGNSTDYAGTVSAEAVSTEAVAPADVALTRVTIQRETVNLILNGTSSDTNEDHSVVGADNTILTAAINPTNATNPQFTWAFVDDNGDALQTAPAGFTLAAVTDHPEQQTVTATQVGTAKVKVTVTANELAADAVTTDIVTITATKKLASISVQKDNADVTAPVVIYANEANALTAGKSNSATLTALLSPSDASNITLNAYRPDGHEGIISIDRTALSTNKSVTVTPSARTATTVGQVTLRIGTGEGPEAQDQGIYKDVTIEVRRLLANPVSVTGDLKVGGTVRADLTQLQVVGDVSDTSDTESGKNRLTYQWYRGDSSDGTGKQSIADATSVTYELTADDFGKYIFVDVTATPAAGFYYEGTQSAASSAVVALADGPDAPTGLGVTNCTTADNDNGTITGLTANAAYELRKETSTEGTWETDLIPKAADAQGVITGLANGNYQVRVPQNDTTHTAAGAWSTTLTIGDYQAPTQYSITIASGIAHGTVSTQRSAVAAGLEVTITVTPATGYQLKTLTVSKTEGTVTVSNDYKFTMPAEAVTISAEFEPIDLTITHALDANLSCGLEGTHTHTVKYGETSTSITITAQPGYAVPQGQDISVTKTQGGAALDTSHVTFAYNATRTQVVITFPRGITENITITGTAAKRTYAVGYTLTGGLSSSIPAANARTATHGEAYNTTLTADSTHVLPATITIVRTNDDNSTTTLAATTDYTYSSTTGEVVILASATTGRLTITAAGNVKTTPVTGAVIAGNLIEGNTLSVTLTPAAATVTYQWQRADSATGTFSNIGTGSSYQLTNADVNKHIRVTVTGTGSFTGSATSAVVGPVAAQPIAAQNISLNKTTASIVFGQSETLTATVTPSNATDKTVTWSVISGQDVVSVANGAVTALKVGTATVRAADSAGHTATCAITVTAAPVSVALSGTAQVGKVLTATFTPSGVTASDFRSVSWYRVGGNADGSDLKLDNDGQLTYVPVAADVRYFIKVVAAEANGNYTGNAEATTSAAVLAEGAAVPTVDVTFTLNGAALANVTGGTVAGSKVTVEENGTLTFKLTVADATKEVKSVKIGADTLTPSAEGVYTIANITADKAVVVTVGDKTVTPPTVDTAALAAAITAAEAAKVGVVEKADGTTADQVTEGTKFVTATEMKALTDAIAAAKTAKDAADKTQATVDAAKTALDNAVAAFKAAIKNGTKENDTPAPPSGGGSSRPSTSTTTTTNPDGSKTTTVTNNRTGTVTATTEKADGTKEVVETKKDGTVTETVTAPDGAKTEKVTDPKKNVTITATSDKGETLAKVEIPATIPAPETHFEDIDEAPWAEEAVHTVAGLMLVEGTGDNKYSPTAPMTRGALATVLHRLSKKPAGTKVSFNDVAGDAYYTEGVAWAAKAGVVTGFSADVFAPDQVITREQLAAMLCRYAKLIGLDTAADADNLSAFTDGKTTGSWATDSVAWCVKVGILQGKGNGTLAPTTQVTRAEVAVMLDRFIALMK